MPRHILIADGPAQPDPTAIDIFWERAQNKFAGLGDDYQVRSLGIGAEDISVVEGMQRGRASPAFDGGLFTPLMNVPTHHFHQWFLARLEQNTTRAVS